MTLEDKSTTTNSSLFLSNYSSRKQLSNTLEDNSLKDPFYDSLNNESLINCISVIFTGYVYNLEKIY